MNKFIVYLYIFFGILNASTPITISDDFQYAKASPFMEYIADKHNIYTINTIDSEQWIPMKTTNLGGLNTYPSWTKFTIRNDGKISQNLILKNPRASMDEIDLYVIQDGTILQHHSLGDKRSIEDRIIAHRYSIAPLTLRAGEEVQVVSRLVNRISSTEGEWELYQHSYFSEFSMLESMWWGLFGGVYLSLFLYLTLISTVLRDKWLILLFGIYVFSTMGYQAAMNGIFYSFGMSEHYSNFITLLFGSFFGLSTIFVVLRFLKISQYKGLIQIILFAFVGALLAEVLILLFSFMQDDYIQVAAYMSPYVGLLAYLIWGVLLKEFLVISKNGVFRYMFFGYTTIIIAYAYQALTTVGLMEVNFLTIYGVSIASIIEIYFFALAITIYIKKMQYEKEKQSKMIDYQMKFISIGKMIGNIAHQWKTPLVRLGSYVTYLESILDGNKTVLQKELRDVIPNMQTNYFFMLKTIDEFQCLYKNPINKSMFKLRDIINNIFDLLSAKVMEANVKLNFKNKEETVLESYEHAMTHVLFIIIENALEIAKKRDIKAPIIDIEVVYLRENMKIIVQDNCGGITQRPIESIFDMDIEIYSNNEQSHHYGMGLSIAKTLANEKLDGGLEAKNSQDGAIFELTLPLT